MSARPALAHARPRLANTRRPSSAIFLGGGDASKPSPPPALPDPPPRTPSPDIDALSSNGSGLPSPPATQAGSAGGDDNGSAPTTSNNNNNNNTNHSRIRSVSLSRSNVENHNIPDTPSRRDKSRMLDFDSTYASGTLDDHDDDDLNTPDDDEGDHTARFALDRRRSMPLNAPTPLRGSMDPKARTADILRQRTSDLLNRISSRANSPAPSTASSSRLSDLRSPAPGASSSTSSALASSTSSRARTLLRHSSNLSGSETEREAHGLSDEEADLVSSTPPSHMSVLNTLSSRSAGSNQVRQRRISAPSPGKAAAALRSVNRTRLALRDESPSAARSSMRPSTALSNREEDYGSASAEYYGANPSGLSRRTTTTGTLSRRARAPLPPQFMTSPDSSEETPHPSHHSPNEPGVFSGRGSPALHMPSIARPPRANSMAAKSATVRDSHQRYAMRWLSEDLSARDPADDGDPNSPFLRPSLGRKQTARGGSVESPLTAYASGERSLVGESLRAAGIPPKPRREVPSLPSILKASPSPRAVPLPLFPHELNSPRTPFGGVGQGRDTGRVSMTASRPTSSLAEYTNEPQTAPPALRQYRSTMHLDRERVAAPAPRLFREASFSGSERERDSISRPGTAASGRYDHAFSAVADGRASRESGSRISSGAGSHLSLLDSALDRLLSGLGKVEAGRGAAEEVGRHAQSVASAAERMHRLLRDGADAALRAYVNAEVEGRENRGGPGGAGDEEVWRAVSGEMKEGVRGADELVRALTELFLGVGKMAREFNGGGGGSLNGSLAGSEGQRQQHLRAASVDELTMPPPPVPVRERYSLDGARGLGGSAAHNTGTIRSDGSSSNGRPGSVLRSLRDTVDSGYVGYSPASRSVDLTHDLSPPASSGPPARTNGDRRSGELVPSASRRQLVPRRGINGSIGDSLSGASDAEPSPTPVPKGSRFNQMKTLPALSIPPQSQKLRSSPSMAGIITHDAPPPSSATSVHRRTASGVTVRASNSNGPASASLGNKRPAVPRMLSTSGTGGSTTAITPTSMQTGLPAERFPLTRSESESSSKSALSVTFSRPSRTAVSELQTRERERTPSSASASAAAMMSMSADEHGTLTGANGAVVGRRRTLATRTAVGRMSADESPTTVTQRRERRPTVTELFRPRS